MPPWNGTTLQGHARIRRFTDTFGFFCDVSLRVGALAADERRLEATDLPPRFRGAVAFGIDYALGKCGYFGGWEATVDRFEHNPVDTTPELVALTTAQGVLRALGHQEEPLLDADRGVVVFPK